MPYRRKNLGISFFVVIALGFALSVQAVNPRKRKDGNPNSRYITIRNESKRTIDMFWIHPNDGALGPSNTEGEGIAYGAQTGIASFVGHDFEVREMGKCEAQGNCRTTQFQCKQAEDQEFSIRVDADDNTKLVVDYSDARTKATEETKRALQVCQSSSITQQHSLEDQFTALEQCVTAQVLQKVDQSKEEISFQRTVRMGMGSRLQSYMCGENFQAAVNLTTSISLRNETYWQNNQIQTLFESSESQIKLYKNFLDEAECTALLETAMDNERGGDAAALERILNKLNAIAPAGTVAEGGKRFASKADLLAKTSLTTSTKTTRNDDGIQARLQILCPTADVEGGSIFFPRAGVVVVPNKEAGGGGDALLAWYHQKNRPATTDTEEEEDFLSEFSMCGVRQGSLVVVEDAFPWEVSASAQ